MIKKRKNIWDEKKGKKQGKKGKGMKIYQDGQSGMGCNKKPKLRKRKWKERRRQDDMQKEKEREERNIESEEKTG